MTTTATSTSDSPGGRPTAAPDRASTRARLLETAARLFYAQGVHIGVDAVCREAGVSKRSMYQLFGSKDELVAATLDEVMARWAGSLMPGPAVTDPRARVLHVFARLEAVEPELGFHGCPFLSAAVEVKSPDHPASAVVRRQKDALAAFFEHEAVRAGADHPARLAAQLVVVFDGASGRSVVRAQPLDGLAVLTASVLLDAAVAAS